MKKQIRAALLLTATLWSGSAFATTIKHVGVDMTRGMSLEIKAGGSARTVTAGTGVILVDGSDLIDAFCVNLFQGISINQTYSAISIDADAYDADGSKAAWMMNEYLPVVNAAAGAARKINGAALQLAIWDAIHDSGNGFDAGSVRSTANTNGAVLALANQWRLESLDKEGAAQVFTAAPGRRAFQQQMYISECAYGSGGCGPSEVPEPTTFAMLAIGGLAVAFGSWRRRDKVR